MTETAQMTLSDFLLARIAEDEAAAREVEQASGAAWAALPVGLLGLARHRSRANFVAECEAKRRIVELHRSEPGYFHHGASTGSVAAWDSVPPDADIADGQPACTTCGEFSEYGVPWPCPTLRLLALPYADHEDYREEWRP